MQHTVRPTRGETSEEEQWPGAGGETFEVCGDLFHAANASAVHHRPFTYTAAVTETGSEAGQSGRRRRGITAARIARIAGVSVPTVSRVINGKPGVASSTVSGSRR
jgi:hypothetical protein